MRRFFRVRVHYIKEWWKRTVCKRKGHAWGDWFSTPYNTSLRFCKRCPKNEEK